MTSTAPELGASVGTWNAVVRRARMGRERKAAALVMSSYARADGTKIHCGVARLAVDLEASYSTARRYLAWLRDVGLIELVRPGNRRKNLSDEYRLILGPDVAEHLDVLDPAEHKALCNTMREVNRGGSKERAQRLTEAHLRSPLMSAETAPDEIVCSSPGVSAETGYLRSSEGRSALTLDERPSLHYISPKDLSLLKPTDDEALSATVTAGTGPAPAKTAPVVEIYPGASQEAPYRAPLPRWTDFAAQNVHEASVRAAARRAAHTAGDAP